MAMTLRLTPEDEAALAELADLQGLSRQEATVRAIRDALARQTHGARVSQASQELRQRYAGLLDRLGQ